MKFKRKKKCVVITISLVLLVIMGIFINRSEGLSKKDDIKTISNAGIVFGDIKAPVKIIEYTDFNCPDCKKMNENIEPILLEYIANKKVVLIFKTVNENMHLNIPKISTEDYKEIGKIFNEKEKYISPKSEQYLKSYLGEKLYNKRKDDNKEIKKEIDYLKINTIPTMYVGNEKMVGIYKKDEFKRIVEDILNSN
ncbi:DsbA family protein [Clostridium sp. CF011]|uniref:thioredoxin domain-containing protein n=1 Tax=Clostridium sp. CF011 TaxID=2843318 RepID=UPI001C0BADF9|nr:thioredoxin domain-containing protein [Clostridium sp. CF011]MBU3092390.1 DsbA family protein [Clostridium sp. CF011]WAG68401.1 DsbA family protein [Clostridium sp. CF011]